MNENNTVKFWRLGIRDAKNWNRWDWSPEYPTLNACFAAYATWLEAHPHAVITFASRTATAVLPAQNKGAQQ